ncbi:hypothetical protein [Thiobacter aerophilum]|uniref:Uncharacterized protein n=1 Tax=Thiobacter aerophilum TaxID=3121275 RepID=A0ABV0EG06_9BURK
MTKMGLAQVTRAVKPWIHTVTAVRLLPTYVPEIRLCLPKRLYARF